MLDKPLRDKDGDVYALLLVGLYLAYLLLTALLRPHTMPAHDPGEPPTTISIIRMKSPAGVKSAGSRVLKPAVRAVTL